MKPSPKSIIGLKMVFENLNADRNNVLSDKELPNVYGTLDWYGNLKSYPGCVETIQHVQEWSV